MSDLLTEQMQLDREMREAADQFWTDQGTSLPPMQSWLGPGDSPYHVLEFAEEIPPMPETPDLHNLSSLVNKLYRKIQKPRRPIANRELRHHRRTTRN